MPSGRFPATPEGIRADQLLEARRRAEIWIDEKAKQLVRRLDVLDDHEARQLLRNLLRQVAERAAENPGIWKVKP